MFGACPPTNAQSRPVLLLRTPPGPSPCPAAGAHVPPRGMAQWLLEEQLRDGRDKQARSQRATSELERERRNILNAMRYREPERGGARPTCCTAAKP